MSRKKKKHQEAAAILAALAIVSHCLDDSCCASTLKTMNIFLLSLGRGRSTICSSISKKKEP